MSKDTRRTGDLIDFDPDTPAVKVALARDDRGISVTVSWSDQESPYSKWFITSPNDGDRAPVPARMLFHDSHGSVLLVGCRPRGFHANMLGPGSGTVWARYAVLGVQADIDFGVVQAMESEISGLRDWLGVTSVQSDFQATTERHVFKVTAESAPPIEVLDNGRLTLVPNWGHQHPGGDDRFVITDVVRSVTRTQEASAWDEHLKSHTAVRDLLVLSRWRRESCVVTRLQHPDDPLITMDGEEHGAQWRAIVVPDDTREIPPTGYRPHVVTFGDIGEEGLRTWIELRDQFARALDPVLSSRFLNDVGHLTLLAQVGPGLEALGYLLMRRDGMAKDDAARASLRERFVRIDSDVSAALPASVADWIGRTVRAYNALKHANRTAPSEVDIANAWRECVLVTRAWVATELGIGADVLRDRLESDAQSDPFVSTVV